MNVSTPVYVLIDWIWSLKDPSESVPQTYTYEIRNRSKDPTKKSERGQYDPPIAMVLPLIR